MYEGPSNKFAWVLPVPGIPKIAVSSDPALLALQQATNPQYRLNTVFDKGCAASSGGFATPRSAPSGATAGSSADGPPNVNVLASGAIGPYDYYVIMVNPALKDRAGVAIDWLTTEGYDIGELGPEVLRPYLDDDLNLVAFRLTKGNSSGAIRPVMVTYDSKLPSIPIRPTAVAANDDMGVMVWLLSEARGIPKNYKALELNEALIDWFNPTKNYNEVVIKAAGEAMGQGFVTEYADKVATLQPPGSKLIFQDSQRQAWANFQASTHTDPVMMIEEASQNWQGWDGFDEALRAAVEPLPADVTFEDFKNCVRCYIGTPGVSFNTAEYLLQLYKQVVKPMDDTQKLLDSRPYLTRVYTTMSAKDMTLDPIFDFNADLKNVSNLHVADRVVECPGGNSDPSGNDPWRVQLPQGALVRGAEQGVWPIAVEDAPAALRIVQYGTSGQGEVIEDRTALIKTMINAMPKPVAGQPAKPVSGGTGGVSGGVAGNDGTPSKPTAGSASGSDCSVSPHAAGSNAPLWLMATGALVLQLRRRRAQRA
jgi:hypothetical protein